NDPINLVSLRGQHNYRNARFSAQCAAERETILAGQHQIENDEVDASISHDLSHRSAIGGNTDAKALIGQGTRNQFADFAMVVNDQDMRATLHEGALNRRATTLPRKVETNFGQGRARHILSQKAPDLKNLGDILHGRWPRTAEITAAF